MEEPVKQDSKDQPRPKIPGSYKRTGIQNITPSGNKALVLLGVTVVGSLAVIAAGVHIGANGENRMYTGIVLWLADFLQSI